MARHPDRLPANYAQDELRYRIRHELFLRPDQTTFTFRNKMDQTALPIRSLGRVHAAERRRRRRRALERAKPGAFCRATSCCKTHLTERYGAAFLPEDMTIQDWGVTYDELEPHYDAFEYLCGTSGHRRQSARPNSGRRQSVRRAALAALSQSRRKSRASATRCSARRRASSATSRSRSRPATCRRPTSIRSACGWAPAPIAVFANGSAAAIIQRPARRPRSCRC